jgi:N-carbamoylputrescine amidase
MSAAFGRDVGTTLDQLADLVPRLRSGGVRLLVLPECALGGYIREPGVDEDAAPEVPPALDPGGPEIARLVEIAGDMVICAGFTERGRGGALHSSLACVSGAGVHAIHRKIHLPPAERFIFTAGETVTLADTPIGRLGLLLCYDKCFPEAARALALEGADVVVCPAAWPMDRRSPADRIEEDRQRVAFDALDVARAVENQVVWVSTNLAGEQGALRYLGRGSIVDPHGLVLAQTGHEGGIAIAEVEPAAAVAQARSVISHLADRRPVAYGSVAEADGPAGRRVAAATMH